MASVEKQLEQNEKATNNNLEVEISSPRPQAKPTNGAVPLKKARKHITPRKTNKQVMGQCKICGYLSSQDVCKACVLLEGLNKARPKHNIEVGYEVQELQQRDQGADGVAKALQRTSIGGD
jgi:cytoplasmic tRNA 2-thiolation protein 1